MRKCSLIAVIVLIGTLAGCSTGYNRGLVAQEWSTSYKLSIANQTLNPDAEKNLTPVSGMDSKAADSVLTKYEKEFEKAPQVPIYTMGLSGGLGRASTSSY